MKTMSKKMRPVAAFFQNRTREMTWFIGGIVFSVAIVSSAQFAANSSLSSQPCALNNAMQDAVNSKIQLIGMTSPDPGKYFNAGSSDSCLGDLSLANLDLSRLIPDPIGLMTDAITAAIDKLKSMAMSKICSAVRGAVGDVIGKYNGAISTINGGLNVQGVVGNLIDSRIGDISRQTMDSSAMSWQTPSLGSNYASRDVLSGLIPSSPASPSGSSYNPSSAGPSGGGVTLLNNNASSAPTYTVAAGNLEGARINLQSAQTQFANAKNTGDQQLIANAQNSLNQAQARYDQARAAVEAAQSNTVNPAAGSSTSSNTTSTGSAVFGR